MPLPRRRRAALLAVVGGALAASVSAAHARALVAPGWRFVMKSTTTVTGGRRAPAAGRAADQVMTVRLQGGRARIDLAGSGGEMAMAGRGGYLLLESGTGRTVVVNPAEKKALVLDGDMFGAGGPMAAMMDVRASDVTIDVQDLGPGATLLGQRTRRYRVTQGYTMTMTFKGMPGMPRGGAGPGPQVIRTRTVSEIEVAPDLARLDPAFEAFGRRFLRGMQPQAPGGAPALAAASEKWPQGLALRGRLTTTTVANGDSTTAVTENVVTEYGAVDVDPAALVVPAGVELVELSRLMRPGARRP